jgi:hypothetical protein
VSTWPPSFIPPEGIPGPQGPADDVFSGMVVLAVDNVWVKSSA